LEKFKPVAERVRHIHPVVAQQRFVTGHLAACRPASLSNNRKVGDHKRGMSLPGRPKVCLYSQMQLGFTRDEPDTTSPRQVGRLRLFGHSKHAVIEGASVVFAAGRHGELHVVKSSDHRVGG
jgi:hypothetical protein